MLLDPVLVAICSDCDDGFAFWAKSTLFKGVAGKILRLIGAVPVQRHQDHDKPNQSTQIDNSSLFDSSIVSLEENRALLLFPEGVSYTESHLQPLKTGGARVVQAYEAKHDKKLSVIPVGLSYTAKDRWRSHVLIDFGKALYLDDSIKDAREQVVDLTTRLEIEIRKLTFNAQDMDTLMELRLAHKIYVDNRSLSVENHVLLQRRFSQIYDENQKDEKVLKTKALVREYREKLNSIGLFDWQINLAQDEVDSTSTSSTSSSELEGGVERTSRIKSIRREIFSRFLKSILLLPLALFGMLSAGPAFFIGRFLSKSTEFHEEKATMKLVAIAVIVPLQYVATMMLLFLFSSWFYSFLFLISSPLIFYFVITNVSKERQTFRSLVQLVWLTLLLRNSASLITDLINRRRHLQNEISALAHHFLAERNEESIVGNLPRHADPSHSYDRDM